MSDVKNEILFVGSGLDTDSAEQFIGKGDAPYRLHILMGEDGLNGIITNMKGNHVATYHDLVLSNAYHVVGSYYNSLTRKVYYWVFSQPYDSDGSGDYLYDNKLLEFDEDTEVISLIFLDTKNYFGLDLGHPVHDCDMIGDYLYFNPRISEPKMIDVVRAKNYTDYDVWVSGTEYSSGDKVRFFGGIFVANTAVNADESPATHTAKWDRIGDSYQNETDLTAVWDSEFRYAFNVLRQIPTYRPICAYGTDPDKHANNVRGKLFRFAYRFRYFDDTHSKFSAYSAPTLPQYDEYYNGEVPEALDAYNYISVYIRLHSASLIKEIEIAFQEIGGDWKLAKVINRWEQGLLDDITYTYKFYNTDPWYFSIPEGQFDIEDSVPRWAATQELINKNVLSYGGVTEGFNNIDKDEIDVTLTPEIEAIAVADAMTTIRRDCVAGGDIEYYWDETQEQYITRIDIGSWYPAGISDGDIIRITVNGVEAAYTLLPGESATTLAFLTALYNFMLARFPVICAASWTDASYYSFGTQATVTQLVIFDSVSSETALTKRSGWKTGAWHSLCIWYYDRAMRRSEVQTSKELIEGVNYAINGTNVYIPMLGECSPTPADTGYRWIVNWEVAHLPPSWAKWWRWGYAGNSLCSEFVQYTVTSVTTDSPWVVVDIAPLQTVKTTATGNQFPQSIINPYQWQQGDRVRFITQKSAGNTLGVPLEGVYDFEILKYDKDTTPGSYLLYVQEFTLGDIGEDTLVEIYSPKKSDIEKLFFEFGELMPIIEDSDGNLVHGVAGVGTQDQDYALSIPATGVFDSGDVYHILRTPSKPVNAVLTEEGYFMESMWYSDFYKSDAWDMGRSGVESNYGEKTLNIVRFSNQLLQNTKINGLSTFGAGDYKELNDIYGDIVGMVEVGNTLKVYMEKKSASILIGRQEYVDTAGQSTIATSTAVLGSVRYPENDFGTQWLESLSKNNRYVYGFDVYNAVVWRDSANGLFPISGRFDDPIGGSGSYKMATWFKEKADALMLSGIENVQVMTVWDERYKNLYVIFKDNANSDNDDVIVFHEGSNRWITFAEFWYTPREGWNQMIELTYEVVKGFDLGIGFEWDEDTRFAIFDIETSNKADLGLTLGAITLTGYNPTIAIDTAPALSLGDITLTAYNPTVSADSPESIVLGDITAIPDDGALSPMTVEFTYDNAGGADTVSIDWRILDKDNVQVNSGTQDVTFLGFVAGSTASLSDMYYPETASATFHLNIKKSSDTWATSISIDFNTV